MNIKTTLALTSILLFLSCATPGRYTKDGLELVFEISEGQSGVLTLPYDDRVEITGEVFREPDGSMIFYTDKLEWFGNWEKGWTQGQFSLTGSLRLMPRGDSWDIIVDEAPVIDSVTGGTLRYGEDKYHGDRARDMISRRWMRMEAAARFAGDRLDWENYSFAGKRERFDSPEYLEDLECLLFPEIRRYLPDYPKPDGPEEGRYERTEGVLWDTLYTEEHIPQELGPVRNSGTLYRDFREGEGLFFLALTWERFWGREIPLAAIDIREE